MSRIFEAPKFARLREKLRSDLEREALRKAVKAVIGNPEAGKKLKGEFKDLRSFRYAVRGQARRLIYAWEGDRLIFLSFGPREGIYK
jgi:mRNA-degrading endonuclease RelE of RelBE toxin-antitoxin system